MKIHFGFACCIGVVLISCKPVQTASTTSVDQPYYCATVVAREEYISAQAAMTGGRVTITPLMSFLFTPLYEMRYHFLTHDALDNLYRQVYNKPGIISVQSSRQ